MSAAPTLLPGHHSPDVRQEGTPHAESCPSVSYQHEASETLGTEQLEQVDTTVGYCRRPDWAPGNPDMKVVRSTRSGIRALSFFNRSRVCA